MSIRIRDCCSELLNGVPTRGFVIEIEAFGARLEVFMSKRKRK